jgi:hypothetical protein
MSKSRELQQVKRAYEGWEKATAELLDVVLRSPLALDPAGRALATVTRAKNLADRAVGRAWRLVGLPSKRDHDRALHALHELESKLLDLEERLTREEEDR